MCRISLVWMHSENSACTEQCCQRPAEVSWRKYFPKSEKIRQRYNHYRGFTSIGQMDLAYQRNVLDFLAPCIDNCTRLVCGCGGYNGWRGASRFGKERMTNYFCVCPYDTSYVFLCCEWKLVDSHKTAAAEPEVTQTTNRNNDLSLSLSDSWVTCEFWWWARLAVYQVLFQYEKETNL